MAYLGLDTLRWVKLLKHPLTSQMKPDILWSIQKLKPKVNVTFWLSGQSDILVLADVPPPPPPGMEKLKSQVKVTFWFWLMYHPPPPPKIEIGLNMNAIEQK